MAESTPDAPLVPTENSAMARAHLLLRVFKGEAPEFQSDMVGSVAVILGLTRNEAQGIFDHFIATGVLQKLSTAPIDVPSSTLRLTDP